MKFVIGIGNPGKAYEKTRHNVGFEVLHSLGRRLHPDSYTIFQWNEDKRLRAQIKIHKNVVLLRPQVFVNNTGGTVSAISEKYHSKPHDILVVCDDVNLEFGKLRLRESGSAGGHHGLESIIEHLSSNGFPRLRVGVGNNKMPKDLTSFVLEEFSAAEKKKFSDISEKAVLVCETWIKEGFESARNLLSRLQSSKEKGE